MRTYWVVVDFVGMGLRRTREEYGPFPTRRDAKRAARQRSYRNISSAFVEERDK